MDSQHIADVVLIDVGNGRKQRLQISIKDNIEISIDDKEGLVAIVRYKNDELHIFTPIDNDFYLDDKILKTSYS